MKLSDFEIVKGLINEIQEVSNKIRGIKNYLSDRNNKRLFIDGINSYFNGFYLTEEETQNIIFRLENERLALVEKLKELGVEMD